MVFCASKRALKGMKSVVRRIGRLEEKYAPEPKEPFVVITMRGGKSATRCRFVRCLDRELALEKDACIQILREGQFSPAIRFVSGVRRVPRLLPSQPWRRNLCPTATRSQASIRVSASGFN
jgi:hypothetical protein